MKISKESSRILGKDWWQYHPYSNVTDVDNYCITLCNKVLKIIRQSTIAEFLNGLKEEKALACILTAYFEDVISETRLFSTFTRLHKKMYGKALPFYDTTDDDYYDDEINLQDIYFLIWYYTSVQDNTMLYDPYFENDTGFNKAVSELYSLFEGEFENAPQNEKLQQFLQLSPGSDVKTVRGKLGFIAQESFLWNTTSDIFFRKIIEKYKKNDIVVLDDESNVQFYDERINFIFNEYLPLLSLRANEYYAEILGEEHPEYQFIKNISTRIFGCFLILKIENNGFLIEHLTSKKQLFLSKEFTSFEKIKLVENETVLSLGLVHWKDDVWQNQGGCIIHTIHEMKGEDLSEHLFADENKKKEILGMLEKAFLSITNGKRIAYMRGNIEFQDFYRRLFMQHAKIVDPEITDEELDERHKILTENSGSLKPFEKDEEMCVYFNPNSGIEVYRESVVRCMPDTNNPYYASHNFDISDFLTVKSFSKEFINYVIENNLINLSILDYENPDMFRIVTDNFDFLLRFFRRSSYFTEPQVTIQ